MAGPGADAGDVRPRPVPHPAPRRRARRTRRSATGNWGVFPEIDYQGIDDAVEIWWDGTVEAEDERGQVGEGAWRRVGRRRRFTVEATPRPSPFTESRTP